MMDNRYLRTRPTKSIVTLTSLLWIVIWLFPANLAVVTSQGDSTYALLSQVGNGRLQTVAWNPADSLIAVGSSIGFQIYDNEWEPMGRVDLGYDVYSLAWSPDGSYLATGGLRIHVWDVETLESVFYLDEIGDVYWKPNDTYILAINEGKRIRVLDISTGQTLLERPNVGANIWTNAMAWSPDGHQLAYAVNGVLTVWDTETDTTLSFEATDPTWFSALTWSPDGRQIATGYQYIDIWDIASGDNLTIPNDCWPIHGLAWGAMGLISLSEDDPSIDIWDTTTGHLTTSLNAGSGGVSLDLGIGERYLVSGHFDSSLKIWDLAQLELSSSLLSYGSFFKDLSWDPTGTKFATVNGSQWLTIWDARKNSVLTTLGGYSNYRIDTVSWSPNGTQIVGGSYSSIYVWDTNTELLLMEFATDNELIRSILWSPNGKRIATLGNDYDIKIWNTDIQQLELILPNPYNDINTIVWSSDGSRLATSSFKDGVKIWNIPSGHVFTAFDPGLNVHDIAWGGIENQIATASSGVLYIWNLDTGIPILTVNGTLDRILWNRYTDLIIGLNGTSIAFVDTISGEVETTNSQVNRMNRFIWEPNTNRVAILGQNEQLQIWGLVPRATTLLSPLQNISTSNPLYSWQDVPEASSFLLHVTDGESNSILEEIYTLDVCQDDICSIESPVPLPPGSYTWRVQTSNAAGTGPWSEPLDFTLETCINDSETLINSIGDANVSGVPTTLCLSQNSIQTFDTPNNGLNALPIITGDITIEGNGATLSRDETADLFRFFEVAPGGSR